MKPTAEDDRVQRDVPGPEFVPPLKRPGRAYERPLVAKVDRRIRVHNFRFANVRVAPSREQI